MHRQRHVVVTVAALTAAVLTASACTSSASSPRAGTSPSAASASATGSTSSSSSGPRVPTNLRAVPDGELMSYVVNTEPGPTSRADAAVRRAGGTVIADWPQIGVVVAQSTKAAFRKNLLTATSADVVANVGATRTVAVKATTYPAPMISPRTTPAPASSARDPREGEQWDMSQLGTSPSDEGSRSVRVGVLDSGVDQFHQDLAANFDAADSASCIDGGRLDRTPAHWLPTSDGHGTHVAGTIAAARNGVGIAGVAPDVRIASVKVTDDGGFIYPEYLVCGFVWAGMRHLDVTNNSYFADPWTYWCPKDPDQAAAKEAMSRAVAWSITQGVVSAAAAGNSDYDLAHKTTDGDSPDDSTPVTRTISQDCLDIPTELPGIVTVSSTDRDGSKSSFSNYGAGVIDVAGPGGNVLSTWPDNQYRVLSGTSMASPHAAGVLALLKSAHPRATPAQLVSMLRADAKAKACPTGDPQCTGTAGDNAFFGAGLVSAARVR